MCSGSLGASAARASARATSAATPAASWAVPVTVALACSRVAVTLAKQRLMTASYDYYELKYPQEGLKGGFIYKTVPHITLKSSTLFKPELTPAA